MFTTHPCLTPPLGRIPFEFLDETYPEKTRGMGLLYGENCMILTLTVFDWSTRVTDRRTDGRAITYTRYSIYAVARKKKEKILTRTGGDDDEVDEVVVENVYSQAIMTESQRLLTREFTSSLLPPAPWCLHAFHLQPMTSWHWKRPAEISHIYTMKKYQRNNTAVVRQFTTITLDSNFEEC